jgi:hypothetical protein
MQTTTYTRKPLTVEAVLVTRENFYEVAAWVEGDVVTDGGGKKFIEVKVLHPARRGHSQAYVGDWLLKSEAGYKIYADTAFKKGFDRADGQLELTREELGFAGIDPGRGIIDEFDKIPQVITEIDLSRGSVSLDVQPVSDTFVPYTVDDSDPKFDVGDVGPKEIKAPHFDGKNFFSPQVQS